MPNFPKQDENPAQTNQAPLPSLINPAQANQAKGSLQKNEEKKLNFVQIGLEPPPPKNLKLNFEENLFKLILMF